MRLGMITLFCLGLGYCARYFVQEFGGPFDRVIGTVRTADKAAWIARSGFGGRSVEAFEWNAADLARPLCDATVLLVSVAPDEAGDPLLKHDFKFARQGRPEAIVYLSTIGVYGDHGGAFVDETTEPRAVSARNRVRRDAEAAWQHLGQCLNCPVVILRLGGIYGPGRNALLHLRNGSANNVLKPNQVFNRVHVADIAQSIDAATRYGAGGIVNVVDDEPSPPQDVLMFASRLIGLPPPPEVLFVDAERTMSPTARSFYEANRRVCNRKLKGELGVTLRYPSYRDGIQALYEAGDHLKII
jgi:nucleoside-diphosphate-sugar epimerase